MSISAPPRVKFAALTDPGLQRPGNEDTVYAEALKLRAEGKPADWLLLAVADGVGGHQRGDWASKKAISVLADELPKRLVTDEPVEALRIACETTNAVTCREAARKGISGAATTLVVALLNTESVWWANAGDSRAYLIQGRRATQLTQDHSLVEEQVRAGQITAEEARESDQRNVITRSVGMRDEVEFDLGGKIPIEGGMTLLLCSDGLTNVVSDEEIAAVVSEGLGADVAARSLIELANERGGPDNVSVVICTVEGSEPGVTPHLPESRPAPAPTRLKEIDGASPWDGALNVLIVLLLIGVLALTGALAIQLL
jgi:protein phosphatase